MNQRTRRELRVLSFSSLFPNSQQERHGIFVEQRLSQLAGYADDIEIRVVAPVPWFPFSGRLFGQYAIYPKVEKYCRHRGLTIYHPRYPVIPKIGMNIAPELMAWAVLPGVKAIMAAGYDFDLLDAHYLYPDGVAAAIIAKRLGKPFVMTARGNDVSLIPDYKIPRKKILWAADRAGGVITVCEALRQALVEMGVSGDRIATIRNGVDTHRFYPVDGGEIRRQLGISGFTLIAVGHLIERKGVHLTIGALKELLDCNLIIVGDGPEEGRLKHLVRRLHLEARVHFVGAKSHQELKAYYSAADVMVLASSREGWPNVLLESMACGTPVVATSIWGTPEVIRSSCAGVLIESRTSEEIVEGVDRLRRHQPERDSTVAYAQQFGWDETSRLQYELFKRVVRTGV